MAFSDLIDQINTHANASGQALAIPTQATVALPVPRGRCIRTFWIGESGPETMGERFVLDAEMVADRIGVVLFIPLGDFNETVARATVLDMRLFKHEFRTRMNGDAQLGGNNTDLRVFDAEIEYPVIGGAQYVTVGFEIVTDFTEYSVAA
jgi:hypothetical protein